MKLIADYLGRAPRGLPQALGALTASAIVLVLDLTHTSLGPVTFRFNLSYLVGFVGICVLVAAFSTLRARRRK